MNFEDYMYLIHCLLFNVLVQISAVFNIRLEEA